MIKQQIINYILSNDGKLPESETWYSIGLKFNVKPPDKKRALKDERYNYKAISSELPLA